MKGTNKLELDLQTAKIALEGLLNGPVNTTIGALRRGEIRVSDQYEAKIKAFEEFIKEEEAKIASATPTQPNPETASAEAEVVS